MRSGIPLAIHIPVGVDTRKWFGKRRICTMTQLRRTAKTGHSGAVYTSLSASLSHLAASTASDVHLSPSADNLSFRPERRGVEESLTACCRRGAASAHEEEVEIDSLAPARSPLRGFVHVARVPAAPFLHFGRNDSGRRHVWLCRGSVAMACAARGRACGTRVTLCRLVTRAGNRRVYRSPFR